MKKRTENKLKLNTETLRHLNPSLLQEAAGGGPASGWGGTSSESDCTATMFSDCRCGATGAC